jgi:Zn-dependent M32 family carboxypeptidase
MPKVGQKAQEAWAEFKESWEMILDIEREGLKLTEVEADKNYDLIMEKLRQAEGLVKKRNDALKRYLQHTRRGE